ncbi:MAG: putative TrmH family tRNA/rRNA methyltransferase [Bacillales bacterium]|jgi:TrmH family RNA methyltransferase|nr:putative TrmH family tRNA/rRNA methyltransferase [Bacillales bacterium]
MKKIESTKNESVKLWKKLQLRKYREKEGLFIVEGYHLVEEALKYEATVEQLIITDESQIQNLNYDGDIFIVTNEIMEEISQTETPQGIAAVCRKKSESLEISYGESYLLVDKIQDPGNLGTIIRTAEASGINAIFLNKGTVDPFNDKVIRSSQGAIFHMPIITRNLSDVIETCNEVGIKVYGTSLQDASPYKGEDPSDSFALILGNEGEGIENSLLNQTHKNLYIPIKGKSESLNVAVAAGILIYYLKNV